MPAHLPTPLTVRSSFGDYEVLVGAGWLGRAGEALRERGFRGRCAVVTDANVGPLYAGPLLDSLREAGFEPALIEAPAGESSKSLAQTGVICDRMIEAGLDRHAFVVALGGGVIGDLAGFAAAIYYRGVPLVQIPTTLLSQVDSAIGGKTGVNSAAGKNLLGAFHPPALAIVDVDTLGTLPERVLHEGMAEAIKHGIIRDRELFDRLAGFQPADLPWIVRRNLEIKAAIVAEDEFERKGLRALLNFGHTIGHGIEQAAGYGAVLHGEAISLGMLAATRLSMARAGLPAAEGAEIVARLERFHLPVVLPPEVKTADVLASLARDKKFEAGAIRFVLTSGIGTARLSDPGEVTWPDVTAAVEDLRP